MGLRPTIVWQRHAPRPASQRLFGGAYAVSWVLPPTSAIKTPGFRATISNRFEWVVDRARGLRRQERVRQVRMPRGDHARH